MSGHIGTANKLAGFDENGLATTYDIGPIQVTGLTINSANWTTGATFYEYDLSNANITLNSIVEIIPNNSDYNTIITAQILPATLSSNGSVKIYAVAKPTGNITVTINITKI